MTKLLNLDDIQIDSQRTVILGGVNYKVVDFDVESFIKFQELLKTFGAAYQSNDLADMQIVLDCTMQMVEMGIPDMNPEAVKKLNPLQMLTLVSMIANMLPDMDEETQETVEKKDQEETLVTE